jgi:hypothetical protein
MEKKTKKNPHDLSSEISMHVFTSNRFFCVLKEYTYPSFDYSVVIRLSQRLLWNRMKDARCKYIIYVRRTPFKPVVVY